MALYGTPQVVNPTLRSQGNQVAGWVDQAAQQIPALNPAAVSGPTQLPPQASPTAVAAVQRHMGGDPFKQNVAPTGVMPMNNTGPHGNTGIVPPGIPSGVMPMNPNAVDRVQTAMPAHPAAGGFAAWQGYRPQLQDWRASRPDTQGMTDEQRLAAVQGWFGSRPASPFQMGRPVAAQAPTWPGARDVPRPAAPAGFAATPNPIPGTRY